MQKGGERERRAAEGTPPNTSEAHASSTKGEGSEKDIGEKDEGSVKATKTETNERDLENVLIWDGGDVHLLR